MMRQLGQTRHHTPKKKPYILKVLILAFIAAGLLFGLLKLFNLDKEILKGPRTVVRLVTGSGLKSDHGRVNVLLLGTGGAGHEGPDLTDTMILASIDENAKDVVLVSIPRDLWDEDISSKINHAYAYGEEKGGKGLDVAKENITKLLGIPVHYAVRVDFGGFTKAVDLTDGLDINVENSFSDPHYPIGGKEDDLCGNILEKADINGAKVDVVKTASGSAIPIAEITDQNTPFTCRYETLNFVKGPTHMNGETALKFVRSRYGTNGEGSDFARSARQEKVILAFRQKVLSSQTLSDPKTAIGLIKTFGDSIDTDIVNDNVPVFAKLANKIDPATIRKVVLDAGRDESVLQVGDPANYGGQYALIPKGTWEDLGDYINGEIFKLEEK